MDNLLDWLALSLIPGLGPSSCKLLAAHCGGPEKALKADPQRLRQVPGIKKSAVEALLARGPAYGEAELQLNRAHQAGVRIITIDDDAYPERLRNIHNPPVLLYVKGSLADLQSHGLAIVGSRAATAYGQQVAEQLAARLAARGLTIISGMALGIDAAAHRGAMKAGGKTLAVLGCGLDIPYPPQNTKLFEAIPEAGALVSEYPLGTSPDGFRFPARNRIISGLSLGVLVVEAARRSGSLITANLALEQGREVFAIPGRVDSQKSEGAHRLLQDGAKLVHTVDDILEELLHIAAPAQEAGRQGPVADPCVLPGGTLAPEENQVLSFLDVYPKTIDAIIQDTALPAQTVSRALLMLELSGLIETLPGKQYRKISKTAAP